jgi:hypothetical protein
MLSLLIKLFARFTARLFLRPPEGISPGSQPPKLAPLRDWPDRTPMKKPAIPRRPALPQASRDDVPNFSL